MAVLLMLRRLGIAVIVEVFSTEQRDIQSLPFNVFLYASIIFVAVVRPYRSETGWQLENSADIAAFVVILITYNSMSNRRDVGSSTALIVFSINVLFVTVLSLVATGQFVHIWRRERKAVPGNKRVDLREVGYEEYSEYSTADSRRGSSDYTASGDDDSMDSMGQPVTNYSLMTTDYAGSLLEGDKL